MYNKIILKIKNKNFLFIQIWFQNRRAKEKRLSDGELERYRFIQIKDQFAKQFAMTSAYFAFL